ncbi:hypothetical protein RJ639_011681 [Escallonia herrerae]|uniref:Transposase MuDR plant domain-containing protein n=1 Tax=Escallonia herrerae TaxID=1293975 RepID=A0AA88VPZ8_9ASTE|nr:hypothetical protein RJ639_011681 [Escallonia herrerae]
MMDVSTKDVHEWFDSRSDNEKAPDHLEFQGKPYFEVGMIFVDNKVFKDVVKQYSINKTRPIKFTKNMRTKIRAVCKSEDCGWFVYASEHDKSTSVQVKTVEEKHTCSRHHINKAAGSKWLAKKYMDRFVVNPSMPTKALSKTVFRELKLKVKRTTIYTAKALIQTMISGTVEEQYGKFWDYLSELKRVHPRTTAMIKLD